MKIRVEITPTVARLLAEYKPASSKGQELESDALQEHYSCKFHDDEGINPGVIVDMIEPPEPPKVAVKDTGMTRTEDIEDQVLRSLPQPKERVRITKGHGPQHQGSHRNKRVGKRSTMRVLDNGNWQFIGDENNGTE